MVRDELLALQFVTFDIEFHNFLGTRGHHPHLLLVHLGEVGDIADLGERLHPLELVRHVQVGPSFTKIGEGGAGVLVVMKLATFLASYWWKGKPQTRQTGR